MRKHGPIAARNTALPATAGLEGLKDAYIRHLTLRNLSPLSLRQCEQAIRLFAAWLDEKAIASVQKVRRETVELYKAELMAQRTRRGTPLSFNTVRGRLFVLQRWFAWLRKKGHIASDPALDLQVPPRVKHLPRGVMSVGEIKDIMAKPDLKDLIGYRDRTIMEFLYSTGARASEACDIELKDVDLRLKRARIRHGKGGKERCVPLSSPCCHFLERYVRKVRPKLALGLRPAGNNWLKKYRSGGDVLFLSIYGGKLTGTWLGQTMKAYIVQAGIARPFSPVHSFRHSVATHLMEGGMDVRYVQSFLGHANINTSTIYMHVVREPLHAKLKEFHPCALHGEFKPFVGGEGYHA